MRWPVLLLVAILLLAACGGPQRRGGYYEDDGPPSHSRVNLATIPDAVPRRERPNPANARAYKVFGKTYYPLKSARGYRQRGVASWYGKKFHGRKTANGETYDVYAMTAAHRTLPLPSYARVTNLRNGRSVIVRVNDRGPFKSTRLIDLSYAAAYRLGIVSTGTGIVEVAAVQADEPGLQAAAPVVNGLAVNGNGESAVRVNGDADLYLQVGAFSSRVNANNLRLKLESMRLGPVVVQPAHNGGQSLYRVRIGPLASIEHGDLLSERVDQIGINEVRLVVD
jgi:rare lipoprotein A